jgi:Leucine-rich repeat (LRR) protein
MKNLLLVFVFLIGIQICKAEYVIIPDDNFRAVLKALYPTCFDASDKMDVTCSQIVNELSLSIENNDIATISGIQYFTSLTYLNCYNNQITNLPSLPASLTYLDCSYNQIIELPILPSTLTDLFCDVNQITDLPILPSTLVVLNCGYNQIADLPILPSTLVDLDCHSNLLTKLPSLPSSLMSLHCYNNQLTYLPSLPTSLNYLDCSNNQITELPSLPSTLKDLKFRHNQIKELLLLPSTLYQLDCGNNQLTALPTLPDMLQGLVCDGNQITDLPPLPSTLIVLYCNSNQLTTIPILPNTIYSLNCSNNQLRELPSLPNTLQYLYCENNRLEALPSLSSVLNTLYVRGNNSLYCLPVLPASLLGLYVYNTGITCLPNAINTNATVDITIPICTSTSSICKVNPYVQGKIYIDANNNGTYSIGERLISQQIVKVLPNNWLGASNLNGSYYVKIDTDINNTWIAVDNYKYATITPTSYSLADIHGFGLQSGSYDFGIHITPNIKDLKTTLGSSPARPGFVTNITVTAKNIGTVDQSNITIKLKKPNNFDVLSTSIVPSSINNDTLIWNNIMINFFEHQSINIQLQVPEDALLGDNAIYEAWSRGTQGDNFYLDNYAIWTETIRGSFDPNDKLVDKTSLPSTYDAENDRLLYTIRFQNTGTDTAFTVIVRDEVLNNLEVNSLQVVNASHPYQLIVREKNIIEVTFPNIQLPDSNTNEAKSHGFVQLEFKPKAGLPIDAEINNNASIFFDYNAPVITNTAQTRVEITTSVASNRKLAFKLFPNPTTSTITVELPYTGNGKYNIIDISGNVIMQNNIDKNTNRFTIDVNDVANGTYLLSLEMDGKVSTSKVMILK